MNKLLSIGLLLGISTALNAMNEEKKIQLAQECAESNNKLVLNNGLFLSTLIGQTEGEKVRKEGIQHVQWDPINDAIMRATALAMNDEAVKNKDLSNHFLDTLGKKIEEDEDEVGLRRATTIIGESEATHALKTNAEKITKYTKVLEDIDTLKNKTKEFAVAQLLLNLSNLANYDLQAKKIKGELAKLKK